MYLHEIFGNPRKYLIGDLEEVGLATLAIYLHEIRRPPIYEDYKVIRMSYYEEDREHTRQESRIFLEFFIKDGKSFDRDDALRTFLEEIIGSTAPISANIHHFFTLVIDEAIFSIPGIEGYKMPIRKLEVINPILQTGLPLPLFIIRGWPSFSRPQPNRTIPWGLTRHIFSAYNPKKVFIEDSKSGLL